MALKLSEYVRATGTSAALVADCEKQAAAMVDRHVRGRTVPTEILDRAKLEVGADLFYRQQTRNGVAGFGDADVAPVHIARDPMRAAYQILAPWTGPGIA